VYNLSERYIYAIIYRIIRDNDKTADLMQDTYIQIYKKIHSLKNVEAFFVWAGRIATNNTLRFIQKDSRDVLLNEEENDFVFENASDDKEEFLPEDILLNKEKREKIRDIINNLSQEQKITVL
jgi:RNA polymerase sigma factor (sigma-70 family)